MPNDLAIRVAFGVSPSVAIALHVEAFEGVCTAKSTIYTANIAAGLMVSQFTKRLRGFSVIQDVSCNVLSMEMGMTV